MSVDSELFIHPSDKAALEALKAIPGFSQVTKAFMKVWNEKQYKIMNMSTNLKLSEEQMAKYYNMLPPICEKLGIEVPELYVKLAVMPNAYTYGDTKPFIVLTSGLFETMPDELISTVIAHECGHIACHHALYTTMGNFILNGASSFVSGLGNIALYPIQLAYAYWMRCSEFSADRAAMIYDESSDKVVEMCMRFAGYDKDIMADASPELFMKQAEEYRKLVNGNAVNKAMEFMMFNSISHPLNAVRAYEAHEWEQGDRFQTIVDYFHNPDEAHLPIHLNPSKYVGKNIEAVKTELLELGFENINVVRVMDTDTKSKPMSVVAVSIDRVSELKSDFFAKSSSIEILYYEPKNDEEIAAEHPAEIKMIENTKFYLGKNIDEVVEDLLNLGFINIVRKEMALPKVGIFAKPNQVAKIMIENDDKFNKDDWFAPDVEIKIYYYVAI